MGDGIRHHSQETPWNLASATYGQIKEAVYDVVVLPFGATEPHNLHLPYGTDTFEADAVGQHLCSAAAKQGARILLLPTIPYGTQTNHRGLPFSLNAQPTTLFALTRDIVESVAASGVRKIVLLNSHGGNDLKFILRELYGKVDAQLFLCFWPEVIRDCYAELFDEADDHAGEMETSMALAYFPDLVARRADGSFTADSGRKRPFRFQALTHGWVSITRPWRLLTTNTGAGDPAAATAEKGTRLMELLVQRLSPFLVELAKAPLDEFFPFQSDSPSPTR